MITNFKIYETFKDEPSVGGYVIMKANFGYHPKAKEISEFLVDNVGVVVHKGSEIRVSYDNVPTEIESWFSVVQTNDFYPPKYYRVFLFSSIVEFADTEEKLLLKIQTTKYNI